MDKNFIQQLKDRTDLVRVVSTKVKLTQQGTSFTGLCPFHQEKTSSFHVRPDRNFYHCFGCEEHGDAITFVQKTDNCDFMDAVKKLAQIAGMQVPNSNFKVNTEFKQAEDLLAKFAHYYTSQLANSKKACEFIAQRGITKESVEKFQLGYADWEITALRLSSNEQTLAQKLGLVAVSGKSSFGGRLMFPIFSTKGKVVGFGGRTLTGSDNAKYLNSKDSFIFKKRRELYGAHFAFNTGQDSVLLVEGYTDVIALYQAGIRNVAATLGTAISSEHFAMLYAKTEEVILAMDGDTAGQKACNKAIDLAMPYLTQGKVLRVLQFAAAVDPDEYIRANGLQGFSEKLTNAPGFHEFLLEQIFATGIDTMNEVKQLQHLEKFLDRISVLPEGLMKERILTVLEQKLQIPRVNLENLLQNKVSKDTANRSIPVYDSEPGSEQPSAGRLSSLSSRCGRCCVILYHNQHLAQDLGNLDFLTDISPQIAVFKRLLQYFQSVQESGSNAKDTIFEDWRGSRKIELLNLYLEKWKFLKNGEEQIWEELFATVEELKAEFEVEYLPKLVQRALLGLACSQQQVRHLHLYLAQSRQNEQWNQQQELLYKAICDYHKDFDLQNKKIPFKLSPQSESKQL